MYEVYVMCCFCLLLFVLGFVLLIVCQGCLLEFGKELFVGDIFSVEKVVVDGKLCWSEVVVWDGDFNVCCQGENVVMCDCLCDVMCVGGVSVDVIIVVEQLFIGGELVYVMVWYENEGLGIVMVEYLFCVNINEGICLVDVSGKCIDVDVVQLDDILCVDFIVQVLLKDYLQVMLFVLVQLVGVMLLENGGICLLYCMLLCDCYVCLDVGQLQIVYDFDVKCNFIGQQVVLVML